MQQLLVRYALPDSMDWDPMINPSKNHTGMPNTMPWIVANLVACCAAILDESLKKKPFKNNDKSKMWTNPQIDTATG
jgi:hypothetical protein